MTGYFGATFKSFFYIDSFNSGATATCNTRQIDTFYTSHMHHLPFQMQDATKELFMGEQCCQHRDLNPLLFDLASSRIKHINHAYCLFFKWAIPFSLFSSFLNSNWQINTFEIFHCRCLDLNRRSMVSEATALPTEPHPWPKPSLLFFMHLSDIGHFFPHRWPLASVGPIRGL